MSAVKILGMKHKNPKNQRHSMTPYCKVLRCFDFSRLIWKIAWAGPSLEPSGMLCDFILRTNQRQLSSMTLFSHRWRYIDVSSPPASSSSPSTKEDAKSRTENSSREFQCVPCKFTPSAAPSPAPSHVDSDLNASRSAQELSAHRTRSEAGRIGFVFQRSPTTMVIHS